MEQYPETKNGEFSHTATRVLAVLGFVAIIGVGMWGAISVARNVPGAFSSLASAFVSLTSIFVPAGETISLSAPSLTVQSGVPFTLSWTHNKKSVDGSYTFRYDCADGVYFTSPSPAGEATNIYCNVPFNFLNSNNQIALTPVSTKNRFIDVAVYVDFTPNGASKATVVGKTDLTVENDAFGTSPTATGSAPVTTTPAPTYHPVTAGPAVTHTYPINGGTAVQPSNPNGYVDLSVRVIEVGVVDRNTGVFTASSTPSRAATSNASPYRIAVRFAVENDGTKTSPQFNFNAVLPTMPQYIFSSPQQQELAPGDRIEFTLAFDSFDPKSNGAFTVNVDPAGSINESNKDNNIVHYTVSTMP